MIDKIEIGKTYRVSAHTRKSFFEIEMFQHEDKGIRFNVETGYRNGSYLIRIENEDEREELQSTIYIEDKQEEPEIWDSDQFSNQECEDTIDPQGYEYTYHGKGWDEQSSEEMTDEINEALEGDEYFDPADYLSQNGWDSIDFVIQIHGGVHVELSDTELDPLEN